MKKIVLLFMLVLSIDIFAEKVQINTSAGEMIMELERAPEKDDSILFYNLLKKLNRLDKEYTNSLNRDDREEAKLLMEDIRFILEALHPEMHDLFIKMPIVDRKDRTKPKKIIMVNDENFGFMVESVEKDGVDKDRLETLKNVMKKDDKITLEQCIKMLKIFPFDEGRYDALEYMYPKIVDKKNANQLIDYFDFISSKERVKKLIKNK